MSGLDTTLFETVVVLDDIQEFILSDAHLSDGAFEVPALQVLILQNDCFPHAPARPHTIAHHKLVDLR